LTTAMQTWKSRPLHASYADPAGGQRCRPAGKPLDVKVRRAMLLLAVAAVLASVTVAAKSQSLSYSGDFSGTVVGVTPGPLGPTYLRPTQTTMASNYLFDAFGPYPVSGAAIAAGIDQFSNAPPEWNQGVKGYARRFSSDFGIAAVGTTTRYGLAEALKEDTMYYRCECGGFFPRLRHAVLSTVTGRHGDDGHRVFSVPALIAPYAGSMTAVYAWYPNRFSAKDGFRTGNYGLLAYVGENIGLEFFYSGPHSLLSRMHMNNTHGSPDPGPNH